MGSRIVPAIALSAVLVASGCSRLEPSAVGSAAVQITTSTIPADTDSVGGSDTPTTDASVTDSVSESGADSTTTSFADEPNSTTAGETTTTAPAPSDLIGELQLDVLNRFAHDTSAFTQGLAIVDGDLIESVGLYGSSGARRYVAGTPEPLASTDLGDEFFGGGITPVGDTIVQLTWREGKAIIRSGKTLDEVNTFDYSGEGWGICDDGNQLIMSDGTATLTFRDRTTFEPVGTVDVTRDDQPVVNLNELECVNGFVWSNVWLSDEILRIDPTNGEVVAWVDASSLVPAGVASDDVLNGIAYSAESDSYFLTGKRWPELFEVRFTS